MTNKGLPQLVFPRSRICGLRPLPPSPSSLWLPLTSELAAKLTEGELLLCKGAGERSETEDCPSSAAPRLPAAPSRMCVIRDRIARVFRMCMSCRRIIRVHHAGVSRVHVARVAGARIMRARPRSQEKIFLRESSARIISVYREI